ncbi:Rv3654c family TadE-like protein [Streptomyces sp. NBC_00859]|uniref:Rv3654c family TadE-like protein n=1 Tax=Streptomyces sp. NBC_00859 TaxID=2903682 RepID=UPI0038690E8D|nr:helicase [Streptomyces sp. NBC_00859]
MAMASLCVVFAALLAMGQGVAARHRAGGAADLAALAAADRALQGQGRACAAAAKVAGEQGARVARCAVSGEIADVTAEARFGPYAPQVRARAGPAYGLDRGGALPGPAPPLPSPGEASAEASPSAGASSPPGGPLPRTSTGPSLPSGRFPSQAG